MVLRQKLPVLPNTWWGIQGGYDLDLVLVYLETCRDFEEQLPSETRQELAKGDRGAVSTAVSGGEEAFNPKRLPFSTCLTLQKLFRGRFPLGRALKPPFWALLDSVLIVNID